MQIDVVLTVDEVRQEQIINRTVIIIDVLRASSTIVTALYKGFTMIYPVETIGQALSLFHSGTKSDTVLAGERYCKDIHDFHYNNSPTQLMEAEPGRKKLILTTTNGTRAIQKARHGTSILIGCFLNATACIEEALSRGLDITLFCAGSRKKYAHEDGLAAGLLIHHAQSLNPNIRISDLGITLLNSYQQCAHCLGEELRKSATGKRLLSLNYEKDVSFCSQVDLFHLVPIVKDNRILSLNSS